MDDLPVGEVGYHEQPDYWTQQRIELRAWFKRNAPSLGELYEGALEMVFREDFPGRVRFVSHAVREIRNRLPDVIAGPKAGARLDYVGQLDKIVGVWEKHGLPLDGSLPTKVTSSDSLPSSNDVPVPREVYNMMAKLVSDHARTREKPREAAKRLFQAIDPNNSASEATLRPRIDHWIKSTEWFVQRVHDRGKIDAYIGAEELKERFEIFERALSAMVREFFKTVEELDAILEEANS